MKVRDSGMPGAGYWETLFDVPLILDRMGVDASVRDLVEFGCGYGTFTLPASLRISGTLHALDLDEGVLAAARSRAKASGASNIAFSQRDFIAEGTGLPDESADYAMLFNILHHEYPLELTREARRVLRPGGKLAAIHWRWSSETPRGPSLDIRPKPEALMRLMAETGLTPVVETAIDLPPWHYGVLWKR